MTASGADLPSPWMVRFLPLLSPQSTVLDLACGAGRHARWLARQGFRVLAVDRDERALAALAQEACIETLAADLEGASWPLSGRRFQAIVVAHYLHRPLFPLLAESLVPGGVLLYETFMVGNERFGPPRRQEFLLRPGELLEFAHHHGLSVVAYEAGAVVRPRSAVIQRLCAVSGDLPSLAGR